MKTLFFIFLGLALIFNTLFVISYIKFRRKSSISFGGWIRLLERKKCEQNTYEINYLTRVFVKYQIFVLISFALYLAIMGNFK